MQETACCFFGHRNTPETDELKQQVYCLAKDLLLNHGVDTFLFGSKSRFNSICYEQVTKLKETYPHIKRIYVRAEFPQIHDTYKAYLLENYEDTYFPKNAQGAGRAVYIQRNRAMIDASRFCIVYCQEESAPTERKSGTTSALLYAVKKNKDIILLPK